VLMISGGILEQLFDLGLLDKGFPLPTQTFSIHLFNYFFSYFLLTKEAQFIIWMFRRLAITAVTAF